MTETEARIHALTKTIELAEETVQSLRDDMDSLTSSMEVFVEWINDETALARLEAITCRLEAVFAAAKTASRLMATRQQQQQLFNEEATP